MTGRSPAARGWLSWAIPAFLFLIAFFHRPALGIVARELMEAFDLTGSFVGLLSATYYLGYAGLTLPAGVLVDTLGVRRVVAAGGAVMGLGTIAMAAAAEPDQLFAGRLLVGLGGSVTFVGALRVAATWFPPSRFATLAALTATMGTLGGLLATAPLAALVGGVGWRVAFGLVGLVTLAGAAACLGWVHDPPPPAGARLRLGTVVAGAGTVLANRHTWPPFVAFFFVAAAAGNLSLWTVPYLRDVYALPTTEAALYATGPALAALVAGPMTGLVSDHVVRRRKLPYTALTVAQVGLWAILIAGLGALPLHGLYLLLLAMGAMGSAYVLTWPIGREVNPPALAGVAVAVVNLGGLLGAASTQGPIGALLDAGWTGALAGGARAYPLAAYRTAFTVCTGFVVAAALTTLLLRETRGRNVWGPPGS